MIDQGLHTLLYQHLCEFGKCLLVANVKLSTVVKVGAALAGGGANAVAATPPVACPLSLSCTAVAISGETAEEEDDEELLVASRSVSRSSFPSRAAWSTWSHSTGPALVPAGIAPLPLFCFWFEEGRSDSEETREGRGGKGKAAPVFGVVEVERGSRNFLNFLEIATKSRRRRAKENVTFAAVELSVRTEKR